MGAKADLDAANAALAPIPGQITAALAAANGDSTLEADLAPGMVTLAQNVAAITAALPPLAPATGS